MIPDSYHSSLAPARQKLVKCMEEQVCATRVSFMVIAVLAVREFRGLRENGLLLRPFRLHVQARHGAFCLSCRIRERRESSKTKRRHKSGKNNTSSNSQTSGNFTTKTFDTHPSTIHATSPTVATDGEMDNLRAENAASRATQNAAAANLLGRRRAVLEEVERLIKTMVQQKVWSKNKFVEHDRAAGQLAKKVLKASNQDGMFLENGTITPDGQGWIER